MFKKFAKSESGAVTVDWVVLAGAVVAVGVGVVTVLGDGLDTAAGTLNNNLDSVVDNATSGTDSDE
ncbi:MAG: pilus assembly protein [Pseudomonadota bacterium]